MLKMLKLSKPSKVPKRLGMAKGSNSFRDAEIPGLLGIIESKKSAEWWDVINDKNCEWTDGPKRQES